MSVLIKGLEMPETEYMDVRIFRDGTATIATGTKPYYRELKAEPVKRGKWIPNEDEDGEHYGDKCSECGEWYFMPYGKTNFCPNCGARIETLIELTWRDIMGGYVTFTEHKTGKRLQWQLNDKVFAPIKKYVKEFGILENQYLFTANRSTDFPLTRQQAWRRIKHYAKLAKIEYPVGCHSLRKSYARWDWDEKKDLLRCSALLGHEDPLTTMTYICLEKGDVHEARRQIDNTSKWV